jgi:hypothetical protein
MPDEGMANFDPCCSVGEDVLLVNDIVKKMCCKVKWERNSLLIS